MIYEKEEVTSWKFDIFKSMDFGRPMIPFYIWAWAEILGR